jgi:hypothetical protein
LVTLYEDDALFSKYSIDEIKDKKYGNEASILKKSFVLNKYFLLATQSQNLHVNVHGPKTYVKNT